MFLNNFPSHTYRSECMQVYKCVLANGCIDEKRWTLFPFPVLSCILLLNFNRWTLASLETDRSKRSEILHSLLDCDPGHKSMYEDWIEKDYLSPSIYRSIDDNSSRGPEATDGYALALNK